MAKIENISRFAIFYAKISDRKMIDNAGELVGRSWIRLIILRDSHADRRVSYASVMPLWKGFGHLVYLCLHASLRLCIRSQNTLTIKKTDRQTDSECRPLLPFRFISPPRPVVNHFPPSWTIDGNKCKTSPSPPPLLLLPSPHPSRTPKTVYLTYERSLSLPLFYPFPHTPPLCNS